MEINLNALIFGVFIESTFSKTGKKTKFLTYLPDIIFHAICCSEMCTIKIVSGNKP